MPPSNVPPSNEREYPTTWLRGLCPSSPSECAVYCSKGHPNPSRQYKWARWAPRYLYYYSLYTLHPFTLTFQKDLPYPTLRFCAVSGILIIQDKCQNPRKGIRANQRLSLGSSGRFQCSQDRTDLLENSPVEEPPWCPLPTINMAR